MHNEMKRLVILTICMLFLFSDRLLAVDAGLLKGQKLYTRTNLTREGKVIYFHNMSQFKSSFPVGTAVVIADGTGWGDQIMFKLVQNGWYYVLYVQPQEYDKYFVKDINDIGLQSMSKEVLDHINNMSVARGMTKKEVYISRGCPSYIGYGVKSYGHALDQVMESNTWYYNRTTRKIEMLVTFKDDVVESVSYYSGKS